MLLKAINQIQNGDGGFSPGSIFNEDDMSQVKRFIELGAAVPIRKTVTLKFSSKTASDDFCEKLMDERRESKSNITIVDGGCEKDAAMSSVSVSEDESQRGVDIGNGALGSLDARVQAESGHVVNHLDGQPVFTPNHGESVATAVHRISCATGLSESDVEQRVQAEIANQGSLLPDHDA